MLSWTGGSAPYFLSLQDGNNFGGPALRRFDQQSGTSFSWIVDVPSNQKIIFLLRDNTGNTGVTAAVTVQPGNKDNCVDKNMSFAPPAASGDGSSPTEEVPPTQVISQGPIASSTGDSAASNSATSTRFGAVGIAAGIVISALL
ncbi:hypothetical protein MPER_01098 [Moniliophthora perniciosa FA553]|nr:hypothetical protein MPER_01098 [Moniliophthora perniciosa FA553]